LADAPRALTPPSAVLPHTLHAPSGPIRPMQPPSLHSCRLFHPPAASPAPSAAGADGTMSSSALTVAFALALAGSGGASVVLRSPRLRSSPQLGAARPHTLHCPVGPITPVHPPSEQSWRRSHSSTLIQHPRAPRTDRSRQRTAARLLPSAS